MNIAGTYAVTQKIDCLKKIRKNYNNSRITYSFSTYIGDLQKIVSIILNKEYSLLCHFSIFVEKTEQLKGFVYS